MRKEVKYPSFMSKLVMGSLVLFMAGCSQPDVVEPTDKATSESLAKKSREKTFYGPATPLGRGVARAWVSVNESGAPTAIGVNISAKAVDNLGEEPEVFTLRLPKQASTTLYNYITLDWNPMGHPPVGTYTEPHFDLHFYMIPEQQVMNIPGMAPVGANGNLQFDIPVPGQYVPANYRMDPGIVPQMGVHWSDQSSHEHHGETFTRTMIWGSYQGQFIFHEPMFTLAYLNHLRTMMPTEVIPLPQPRAYQKPGYYPLTYTFMYNESPKEYTIALTDLTYRR